MSGIQASVGGAIEHAKESVHLSKRPYYTVGGNGFVVVCVGLSIVWKKARPCRFIGASQ